MSMKKFTKKVAVIWIMAAIVILAAGVWIILPGKVQGAQNGRNTDGENGDSSYLIDAGSRGNEDDRKDLTDTDDGDFLINTAEYIKAAAYAHIGRLSEEYRTTMPLYELYSNDTLDMILHQCVEALGSYGITADEESLKNTYVDIVCRLDIEEESREYAASMLAERMYEYLKSTNIKLTDMDADGFEKFRILIEEYMTSVFNEEKENIKFDYDILTSDRDIIIQLLKSNGMSQSDAEIICREVVSELNTIYTDMRLEAVQSVIDKQIDKAAGNISQDIYEAVISAISSYKENIAEITDSIDRFSRQYQLMSSDIDTIRKQISDLEADNSHISDDSSEYSNRLAKLKKRMEEQNNSLNKLAEQIAELKTLKESISILSVSQNDAQNQMRTSVETLKSELLRTIESLREENNVNNEEERIRTEQLIADMQNVLDKISNEHLTVKEFEIYRLELSDLIENMKSDTNTYMNNISRSLEEEIQKLSGGFTQYVIALEAKQNEDKEAINKNLEEIQYRISQDKQAIEDNMSNLDGSLAQMLNELDEYRNLTGERFDNIVSDITSANEHADNMERRLTASEDKYTSVEDRLAASENKYASVEDRLTVSENKYASIEDRLAASEDKYVSADSRIKALDASMLSVENILTSVNDKITLLKEQVVQISGLISGNTSQIDKLEREMTELKKSVSDGKAKVAGAVTANGVYTAADAGFETIAKNINKITEQNKQEVKYGSISVSAYNTSDVSYSTYEEYDGDECSRFEVAFPKNSFICYKVCGKGEGYDYANDWHEACRENYVYVAGGGKNSWVLTGPNWHKPEFETEGLTLTVEYWYLPG